MNKKITSAGVILIIFTIFTSGCVDYLDFNDKTTTYESHPTNVAYKITYGYFVNCSGNGSYNIQYDCDKPDEYVTTEISSLKLLHNTDYEEITKFGNPLIIWNITKSVEDNYKLGITANVQSESFLISDLNEDTATTLNEIKTNYTDVYNQYTSTQSSNNILYIDPSDENISSIAKNILNQNTNNSFILAKELFIWLKENTQYKTHLINNDVQPAHVTCIKKTGDCDDLSFLYMSLCRAIGLPARFIRGFLVSEDDAGQTSAVAHAWVEVFVGNSIGYNGWIPVECAGESENKGNTNPQVYQNFGVESAEHLRLYTDDGSNESLNLSISGPLVLYDTGLTIEMSSFVSIADYIVITSKELFIDENEYRSYKS